MATLLNYTPPSLGTGVFLSTAFDYLVSPIFESIGDLFFEDQQGDLLIFRRSSSSTFVLGVSVGYFLYDLGLIFWFYPSLGGLEYVLHHLLSMTALGYALSMTTLGKNSCVEQTKVRILVIFSFLVLQVVYCWIVDLLLNVEFFSSPRLILKNLLLNFHHLRQSLSTSRSSDKRYLV